MKFLMIKYPWFWRAMSDRSREKASKHLEMVERHYHQAEILEDLFSRAIEVYIFLNASRLLLPEGKNWTTCDGNEGSPLDAQGYAELETVYLEAMLKMLEADPGRAMKLHFIELVIGLANIIGHKFAPLALKTIAEFSLEELVHHRHHFASTA